jgi:hypothetical protein
MFARKGNRGGKQEGVVKGEKGVVTGKRAERNLVVNGHTHNPLLHAVFYEGWLNLECFSEVCPEPRTG